MQDTLFIPAQQHAADTCRLGALIPGVRDLVAAARAQPSAAEEVPLFPLEDGGVGVGRWRQHPALAKWLEGLGDGGPVDRSGRRALRADGGLRELLTDHTV